MTFSSKLLKSTDLIAAEDTALLIIDAQEKLLPSMSENLALRKNIKTLARAAHLLDIPIVISEQYPDGLGPTISRLLELAPNSQRFTKTSFSISGSEEIMEHLASLGKSNILVCGMESHVCVLQSVMDLIVNTDDWIFVVADAIGSRTDSNQQMGLDRMISAGARSVSTEMVIFEWLRDSKHPKFKEIQQLVK